MPFQSEAQRKFLYAVHPNVAKKFAEETPKGADLPSKLGSQSADSTRKQTIRQKALERMAKNG